MPRKIFILSHADPNEEDSDNFSLSEYGKMQAQKLAIKISYNIGDARDVTIWTAPIRPVLDTSSFIRKEIPYVQVKTHNELLEANFEKLMQDIENFEGDILIILSDLPSIRKFVEKIKFSEIPGTAEGILLEFGTIKMFSYAD